MPAEIDHRSGGIGMLGQELRLVLDLAGQRVDFIAWGSVMRLSVPSMVLVGSNG